MALSDGLVGYWSPWLGSSGYKLLDQTPYRNHGTLTNMDAGTDWVGATINGRSGYALDFDGTNDGASIASFKMDAMSNATNTVSFWMNPTTTNTIARPISMGDFGNNFAMRLNFQNLEFTFGGTAVLSVPMSNGTYSNLWTHVVGVADSSGAGIFFNGVQVGTRSDTVSLTKTNGMGIGYRFGVATDYFSGRIANVSIHNRALTASEIATLYRLGPGWYKPQRRRSLGYVPAATTNRRRRILIGASQ
jgi:hypothetical protein